MGISGDWRVVFWLFVVGMGVGGVGLCPSLIDVEKGRVQAIPPRLAASRGIQADLKGNWSTWNLLCVEIVAEWASKGLNAWESGDLEEVLVPGFRNVGEVGLEVLHMYERRSGSAGVVPGEVLWAVGRNCLVQGRYRCAEAFFRRCLGVEGVVGESCYGFLGMAVRGLGSTTSDWSVSVGSGVGTMYAAASFTSRVGDFDQGSTLLQNALSLVTGESREASRVAGALMRASSEAIGLLDQGQNASITHPSPLLHQLRGLEALNGAWSNEDWDVWMQADILLVDALAQMLRSGCWALTNSGRHGQARTACMAAALSLPRGSTEQRESLGCACFATHSLAKRNMTRWWYEFALHHFPQDERIRSNFGALLLDLDDFDGVVEVLEGMRESETRNPFIASNLAHAYARRDGPGDVEAAAAAYRRAYGLTGDVRHLLDVAANAAPVILMSREGLAESRRRAMETLMEIEGVGKRVGVKIAPPFYFLFHGYNDRPLLEKFARVTEPDVVECAEHLCTKVHQPVLLSDIRAIVSTLGVDADLMMGQRKVRVGFMSSFFTINHAHGLLLRGVLGGLDRDVFETVSFPGSHLTMLRDPEFAACADREVVIGSLEFEQVLATVKRQRLDVLIFADQHAEAVTYNAAAHRLAAAQVAFWGTPGTAGRNPSVDYYFSADRMEIGEGYKWYSEQLVRPGGQGIWYEPFDTPGADKRGNRTKFGLPRDGLLLSCPQSTFKLNPSLDDAFAAILRSLPEAKLVLVRGRHDMRTMNVQRRLNASFPDVADRILWVDRQPHMFAFMELLSCMDIVLHPFPFGGSKTSADAIAMGIPLVTMHTNFLRARMARSLLLSIGAHDLVTGSPVEYVRLAVALGRSATLRQKVGAELARRSKLIWRRRETVLQWQLFLLNAVRAPRTIRESTRATLYSVNAADNRHLRTILGSSSPGLLDPQTTSYILSGPPTSEERRVWTDSCTQRLVDDAYLGAGSPVAAPWETEGVSDEQIFTTSSQNTHIPLASLPSPVEIGPAAGEVVAETRLVDVGGIPIPLSPTAADTVTRALDHITKGEADLALRLIDHPRGWEGNAAGSTESFILNAIRGTAFSRIATRFEGQYAIDILQVGELMLEEAVGLRPDAVGIWSVLVTLHSRLNRPEKSLLAASKALALAPDQPHVLYNWIRAKEQANGTANDILSTVARQTRLPSQPHTMALLTCLASTRPSTLSHAKLAQLIPTWLQSQPSPLSTQSACSILSEFGPKSTTPSSPQVLHCNDNNTPYSAESVATALLSAITHITKSWEPVIDAVRALLSRVDIHNRKINQNPSLPPLHDSHFLSTCPSLLRHLQSFPPFPLDPQPSNHLHLILQPFHHTNQSRILEVTSSIAANLRNPEVEKIHMLFESQDVALLRSFILESLGDSAQHLESKLVTNHLHKRLDLESALSYANQHIPPSSVALILNADIVLLPHSLASIAIQSSDLATNNTLPPSSASPISWTAIPHQTIWMATRWEVTNQNHIAAARSLPTSLPPSLRLIPRTDSQDIWAFRVPLHSNLIRPFPSLYTCSTPSLCIYNTSTPNTPLASCVLGYPRIDGVSAHLFHSDPNIALYNPGLWIPTAHIHGPGLKTHMYTPSVLGTSLSIPF